MVAAYRVGPIHTNTNAQTAEDLTKHTRSEATTSLAL